MIERPLYIIVLQLIVDSAGQGLLHWAYTGLLWIATTRCRSVAKLHCVVVQSFSPVSNALQVLYFYQGSLLPAVGQSRGLPRPTRRCSQHPLSDLRLSVSSSPVVVFQFEQGSVMKRPVHRHLRCIVHPLVYYFWYSLSCFTTREIVTVVCLAPRYGPRALQSPLGL